MIAEFNAKECIVLSDLIERYQRAIERGIKSMKKGNDVKLDLGKMGVFFMSEEEARKTYRLFQPLFITFFKGSRGY